MLLLFHIVPTRSFCPAFLRMLSDAVKLQLAIGGNLMILKLKIKVPYGILEQFALLFLSTMKTFLEVFSSA